MKSLFNVIIAFGLLPCFTFLSCSKLGKKTYACQCNWVNTEKITVVEEDEFGFAAYDDKRVTTSGYDQVSFIKDREDEAEAICSSYDDHVFSEDAEFKKTCEIAGTVN